MTVYLRNRSRGVARLDGRRLRRVAERLLAAVGEGASSLSLTFVRDREIRLLNRTYRGKDRATDVLSFPLIDPTVAPLGIDGEPERGAARISGSSRAAVARVSRPNADAADAAPSAADAAGARGAGPDAGVGPSVRSGAERLLGDVVISLETAGRQAAEYDAPLAREVERLLIHGLLHLLGHDHEVPAERKRMEAEERRLAAVIALPWPYD